MQKVVVRHNFETAHRLPELGSAKCSNLHGHSWWVDITVSAPAARPDGTVVEFGELKAGIRAWIDTHLDHGAMLSATDPLTPVLAREGSKVFRFGSLFPTGQELHATDLMQPSVENVAALLGRVAAVILFGLPHADGAAVTNVTVSETHVNSAAWAPDPPNASTLLGQVKTITLGWES